MTSSRGWLLVALLLAGGAVWWAAVRPSGDSAAGELDSGNDSPEAASAGDRSLESPRRSPAEVADTRAAVAPALPTPQEAARAPALVGEVFLAGTGERLAGVAVDVRLVAPDGTSCVERRTTGDDGCFDLVLAEPAKVAAISVAHGPSWPAHEASLDLDLAPGGGLHVQVPVPPGWVLRGVVRGAAGEGLPRGRVLAWNAEMPSGEPDRHCPTDGWGEFRVPALGASFFALPSGTGVAPVDALLGRGTGPVEPPLDLHVAEAAELAGRIVDSRGLSVEGAMVQAELPGFFGTSGLTAVPRVFRVRPPPSRTTSKPDGSFAIGPLPRAEHSLRVEAVGFGPWSGPGMPGVPMEIQLAEPASIDGQVVDPLGRPVESAEVHLHDEAELLGPIHVTDSRGRFSLEELAGAKDPWFVVRARGFAVHLVEGFSVPPAAPLLVRLEPALALAGVVVDQQDQPVARADMFIEGDRLASKQRGEPLWLRPTWESLASQQVPCVGTDQDGRFRFEELYTGSFRIHVWRNADPERRWLFTAPSGSEQLRLVIDEAARHDVALFGRVRDARTGNPVPRFWVTAIGRHPDGRTFNSETREFAAGDGLWRIGALLPMELGVVVRGEGYAQRGVTPASRAPGEHRIDLDLYPSRSLHLRVRDASDQPVAEAWVSVSWGGRSLWIPAGPGGRVAGLRTDEAGEVHLHDLPAASIELRVQPSGAEPAQTFAVDLAEPIEGIREVKLEGTPAQEGG